MSGWCFLRYCQRLS